MPKDLFQPIVQSEKRHPHFERTRTWPGAESGRVMINEIFQSFPNRDGNFIEQFQTTGTDARIFELYLYAYFLRSGFEVSMDHGRPDFMVKRNGLTVAIEATTVNPTQRTGESVQTSPRRTVTPEEVLAKNNDELAIRFGSPLFTKLNKKYWELEQCKGLPLVFAIEAFHESDSLIFSSSALTQYVFGLRWKWPAKNDKGGKLVVAYDKVETHLFGNKEIPSHFFGQPDAERISAIIFTNSGTLPKFERMGYQAGHHRGNVKILRTGTAYNYAPNSGTPLHFQYSLDEAPTEETWGEGMVVLHNPIARRFQVPSATGE